MGHPQSRLIFFTSWLQELRCYHGCETWLSSLTCGILIDDLRELKVFGSTHHMKWAETSHSVKASSQSSTSWSDSSCKIRFNGIISLWKHGCPSPYTSTTILHFSSSSSSKEGFTQRSSHHTEFLLPGPHAAHPAIIPKASKCLPLVAKQAIASSSSWSGFDQQKLEAPCSFDILLRLVSCVKQLKLHWVVWKGVVVT